MTPHTEALLLFGQAETVYYRFNRCEALTEGWQWLALLAVGVALLVFVVRLHARDTVELSRPLAIGLLLLRLAALAGVIFYFLDLEKGTERTVTLDSRAVLLVDISQSMAQVDVATPSGSLTNRSTAVATALEQHQVLERLRERHEVHVLAIGESERPVALASFVKKRATVPTTAANYPQARDWNVAIWVARMAVALLALGALLAVVAALFAWRRRLVPGEAGSWPVLAAVVFSLSGLIAMATVHVRFSEARLAELLAGKPKVPAETASGRPLSESPADQPAPDWNELLAPRGRETRLGDALYYTVLDMRGGPVAGIVVVSDGQSTAGLAPALAAAAAQEASIPVHTVAVGSDRPPINVRVVDVEAPLRVYPGDRFEIKAYLQAYQMEGRSVDVRLLSASAEAQGASSLEDQKTVRLGSDGAMVLVEFQVTPPEVGKRLYTIEVAAPTDDLLAQDNAKTTTVDVVEQRTRVLIVAGGPTREYQFVRNLLYRDRDVTTAVLLQSGEPGISQEGDEILFDFPNTWQEMTSFDCVLAFDPDWTQLDEDQLRLLDRWVSEQSGGLLLVGGPIHTPHWSGLRRGTDARIDLLKALYPVVFPTESSARFDVASAASDEPWPLQLTRDGTSEKFLWLDDDPVKSEAIWASFPGVYGYLPVREIKKGAWVYAYYTDATGGSLDEQPAVYWASHFYGSGRVFFAASGEMWRLRALDEAYFNRFYTKLVRWLSQGRLARGSKQGLLLVDKERCSIGDNVVVTAIISQTDRQPVETPNTEAILVAPDGMRQTLLLRRVMQSSRAEYQTQFTPRQEGDYHIEWLPPQSTEEPLAVDVRCSSSIAETRSLTRNDAVMQEIAQRTGGRAYTDLDVAFGSGSAQDPDVISLLVPQDQQVRLPGTPDRQFKLRLHAWLMALVAGALAVEWTLRRLSRLA